MLTGLSTVIVSLPLPKWFRHAVAVSVPTLLTKRSPAAGSVPSPF